MKTQRKQTNSFFHTVWIKTTARGTPLETVPNLKRRLFDSAVFLGGGGGECDRPHASARSMTGTRVSSGMHSTCNPRAQRDSARRPWWRRRWLLLRCAGQERVPAANSAQVLLTGSGRSFKLFDRTDRINTPSVQINTYTCPNTHTHTCTRTHNST